MSHENPEPYVPASYDPMNTESVSAAICRELERQPLVRLPPDIPQFDGSGLYAIYYTGESVDIYNPLAALNIPVYVGKSNAHNGSTGKRTSAPQRLWRRVCEHHASIVGAGLPIDEFRSRFLLLPDVHNGLGERGLLVNYRPVWNDVLNGFGSREQGSTTRQSSRSKWDTVHRGRARTFGKEKHSRESLEESLRVRISQQVEEYGRAPWRD